MTGSGLSLPFHAGEIEVQKRLGVHEKVMSYAPKFIRDFMPRQHREFYAQLPMFFVGSVDDQNRPWASVVFGKPGFLNSPNPKTLRLNTRPVFGDPLNNHLAVGAPLGFLGMEYQSRRRNRLNGKVTSLGAGWFEVGIDQSFGNCPQYIQARCFQLQSGMNSLGEALQTQKLKKLNRRAKEIIAAADNFYIATHFQEEPNQRSQGTDISHRGGRAGFVKVDGETTLAYPDFAGNNHFNTLGNIQKNPKAGLLFIDFKNGDLLLLTCSATIDWENREVRDFKGAKRLVSFKIDEGLILEKAMPIHWNFLEDSPELANLGSWEEVKAKQIQSARSNRERDYRIFKVEKESEDARSFYLEPVDGKPVDPHLAGQFLPIKVSLDGRKRIISRTYTISNAPNNQFLRLTIKRVAGGSNGSPPGLVSTEFHENVAPGSVIQALRPAGKLTLSPSGSRPVVLISAGIGITPMMSILGQLFQERQTGGQERRIWFVHGARHGGVHSFRDQVARWQEKWPELTVHYRYSRPRQEDRKGVVCDSIGRIDVNLLKSLLPFDDYDFYLCGPSAFLKSLYQGLRSLNVLDARIHYEFFGKSEPLSKDFPNPVQANQKELAKQPPVMVQFAKSAIQVEWNPSRGTLLELAESMGLEPPNSCRAGICNTCSTRILAGRVAYQDPEKSGLENNQALICSSYPVETREHGSKLVLEL